jgi:hypothetical protein
MFFKIFFFTSALLIAMTAYTQPRFTFHTRPNTNSTETGKTVFKTNEFIYARVELGKTVKEYFKISEPDDPANPHILIYNCQRIYVYKNKDTVTGYYGPGDYLYISPEDLSRTYLEIDILPDPAIASDVFCMVGNFKGGWYANPVGGMNGIAYDKGRVKSMITNIVVVGGTTKAGDAHNKAELPKAKGSFQLVLDEADFPQLSTNKDLSDKKVQQDGLVLASLPTIFSKPFKTNDPKLTAAKLSAILKRDYPYRKVLKMALDADPGPIWGISKNSLDIPRYRYFKGLLHVAYIEDGVCKVGSVELTENYLGGGKYGVLSATSWSEYDRKINCAVVK